LEESLEHVEVEEGEENAEGKEEHDTDMYEVNGVALIEVII
jgi:hypothetical protein